MQTDKIILTVGFDEAGRGPLAGPVYAAAAILPPDFPLEILNDSKKLSEKKRLAAEVIIKEKACYGIAFCDEKEIDKINILQASFLAMQRALDEVIQKGFRPTVALIDGNRLPDWEMKKRAIIGGDAKSLSIAAASILAKVTRDRIMTELAKKYPHYGWEKNAGYGTKAHQAGLAQFGITPEHRLSYAPIKKLLGK